MENKDKKIKELEEKLLKYESMPHADFYTSLLEGVAHITSEIKNKTLNFDEDVFAKNIFALAKDSDKIMSALEKGQSFFLQKPETTTNKKADKSNTVAI